MSLSKIFLPVSIKESKLELSVCLNAVIESEFELSVGPDLSIVSDVEPCVCPISIYESVFCPTSPVTTPETLPELSVGSSSLVTAQGPAVELLTLSVMNSETINALYVCPISTKEPDFELSASPGSVTEMSVSPVSLNESVFELSVLPVSVNELSASVYVYAPDFELSVSPVPAKAFDYELSVGPVPVTEMSVSPVSLNESVFELSILPVTAMETLNELSVCSVNSVIAKDTPSEQSVYAVPVHELNIDLAVCPTTLKDANTESVALSVTTQKPAFQPLNLPVMSPETINASHVFRVGSVNAIETIYELSSCSVSVNEPGFELSASNPVYELSFRPVSVSRPIDDFVVFSASSLGAMDALSVSYVSVFPRSQSLPWSSGLSAPPRLSSAPVWWSSTPVWWSSAPSWWPSAQVWWSSAPFVSVWWSSALPWRSSALSPLYWWTPVLFAQPWRSSAPSAPPWWAPVPSALPWWAPVPSAPPWWAPVPSTPPWLPALPTLPRSLATPLPRGPGPLSLPLFRLRSTALLDCIGASGSRSLGGGGHVMNLVYELPLTHHQRSLAHHMDSCSTLTVARHLRLQFPSSIALTTHIADCTDHTPYINHGLPLPLCRVLYSVYHSPSDSYSTEPTQLS